MMESDENHAIAPPLPLSGHRHSQFDVMPNIQFIANEPDVDIDAGEGGSTGPNIPVTKGNAEVISRATAVTALLSSNNAEPSNVVTRLLSSAIEQLAEDISHNGSKLRVLELQERQIRGEIERLKEKEAQIQVQRDLFRAYLSPLRRLPPEVLAHIFSYHMHEDVVLPVMPSLLWISQVCRSWRSACLGCASLWTSLSIDVQDPVNDWSSRLQPLPRLWFAHSKDLPLKFSFRSEFLNLKQPHPLEPFNALFPFLCRLTELRVLAGACDLAAFFNGSNDGLPLLETLSIGCSHPGLFSRSSAIEMFRSAPRLRIVALALPSVPIWDLSVFIFPWTRLTSLDIKQVLNGDACLAIFGQCSRLEIGSFVVDGPPSNGTPPPIVIFQNLRTLTIKFWNDSFDIGCLDTLYFPALQDLSINANDPIFSVHGFLKTFSTATLRRLCLKGWRLGWQCCLTSLLAVRFWRTCESTCPESLNMAKGSEPFTTPNSLANECPRSRPSCRSQPALLRKHLTL